VEARRSARRIARRRDHVALGNDVDARRGLLDARLHQTDGWDCARLDLARDQAPDEGERVQAIKAKGKNQKAKGKGKKTVADRQDLVAAGGIIANIGVHGEKVDLHLERLWSHNISITTRLVDTVSTPMLLKTVQAGKIDPTRLAAVVPRARYRLTTVSRMFRAIRRRPVYSSTVRERSP
jgi:threonine dehydrogenase-like Zn-dependent dehydrogenase